MKQFAQMWVNAYNEDTYKTNLKNWGSIDNLQKIA